ncbi:MAG: methyltransferase domain-containing protein, partial [Planctomycetes bacterium]|nr:methyltransferase domain-containing protein [Planctomycetota bacterium]
MPSETIALARSLRGEPPPSTLEGYLSRWESFFDRYALEVERWHSRNLGYHEAISRLAGFYVPPGARVLEIGSGTGDLLASLRPSYGVGVDLSRGMVDLASRRHPELHFRQMPAERLDLPGETFDYVVLSDLLGFLFDIGEAFRRIRRVCHARTRVVMHWYSRLWQPILAAAETVGKKHPLPLLNWTTPHDDRNLLHLAEFETVREGQHILVPARIPLVAAFANRFLAHLPGLRSLCLTRWIVARPLGLLVLDRAPRVSVVCPCRNEAGNIEEVVRRLPRMGAGTELLFVEGHSSDNTLDECRRVAQASPDREIRVLVQEG